MSMISRALNKIRGKSTNALYRSYSKEEERTFNKLFCGKFITLSGHIASADGLETNERNAIINTHLVWANDALTEKEIESCIDNGINMSSEEARQYAREIRDLVQNKNALAVNMYFALLVTASDGLLSDVETARFVEIGADCIGVEAAVNLVELYHDECKLMQKFEDLVHGKK
eukprot:1050497_1